MKIRGKTLTEKTKVASIWDDLHEWYELKQLHLKWKNVIIFCCSYACYPRAFSQHLLLQTSTAHCTEASYTEEKLNAPNSM